MLQVNVENKVTFKTTNPDQIDHIINLILGEVETHITPILEDSGNEGGSEIDVDEDSISGYSDKWDFTVACTVEKDYHGNNPEWIVTANVMAIAPSMQSFANLLQVVRRVENMYSG